MTLSRLVTTLCITSLGLLPFANVSADEEAKLVCNPVSKVILAPTGYEACADEKLFRTCQELTEQRGRCQRGIPRVRDLTQYLLSCRIIDATDGCGAMLYGRKEGNTLNVS